LTLTRDDLVTAATTDAPVGPALAVELVGTSSPSEDVVAGSADQVVLSLASAGEIPPERALERVVPAEPEEGVGVATTGEVVVAGCPHDVDRSAATPHELVRARVTRPVPGRPALVPRAATAPDVDRRGAGPQRHRRRRTAVARESTERRPGAAEVGPPVQPARISVVDAPPGRSERADALGAARREVPGDDAVPDGRPGSSRDHDRGA
jgi:hypothetical protein